MTASSVDLRSPLRILVAGLLPAVEKRFPNDQDAAARYMADMLTDWANEKVR